MSKTDALDLVGLVLVSVFAFAVWPPLCLLVFGLGALAASRTFAAQPVARPEDS